MLSTHLRKNSAGLLCSGGWYPSSPNQWTACLIVPKKAICPLQRIITLLNNVKISYEGCFTVICAAKQPSYEILTLFKGLSPYWTTSRSRMRVAWLRIWQCSRREKLLSVLSIPDDQIRHVNGLRSFLGNTKKGRRGKKKNRTEKRTARAADASNPVVVHQDTTHVSSWRAQLQWLLSAFHRPTLLGW